MRPIQLLTYALLASLSLAACGDKSEDSGDSATDDSADGDSATDDSGDEGTPESCADVLAADSAAADGAYTLYWEGDSAKPWDAWCADMSGTPTEYLVLVNTGTGQNVSAYVAGGSTTGTDVRTRYTRVHVDLAASMIEANDQRFATTEGTVYQGDAVITVMAYGSGAACGAGSIQGDGNVDLRGTPFTIADNFSIHGYEPSGQGILSDGDQVADLTIYGNCGSIYADSYQNGGPANLAGQGGILIAYGG